VDVADDHVYTRHLAFNRAWEQVRRNPEILESAASFAHAARYHHSPDRLFDFKDYRAYMLWFVEIYRSGQYLVHRISRIACLADCADSKWYSSKRKPRRLLREYGVLNDQLVAFRDDVAECQICFLASGINHKTHYSDSLSDLLRQLDALEVRIFSTVNQKLSEISTTRLALTSLAVSLLSLVAVSCVR